MISNTSNSTLRFWNGNKNHEKLSAGYQALFSTESSFGQKYSSRCKQKLHVGNNPHLGNDDDLED